MGLSDNVQNIGRRLTDQGIHSAYIGKWHLDGGDYFGLGRCADGWDPDYWYDMRCYLEELTEEERYLSRQTESMEKYDIDVYKRQLYMLPPACWGPLTACPTAWPPP